jgi:uncharacterized protein (TIGR02145 family)
MQAMTPEICDRMPDDYSTMTLTDTRNNQDYRVRKMPDGKCWMIDNLKLATPGTALTLDHNNSNITDDQYTFVIPANPVQDASTHSNGRCDSGGTLTNGSYLTCNGTSTQSTTNSGFAAYSDPGDTTITYISCSEGHMVDPASTTGCGYLYNWYTATAGTGTYELDGTTGKTQAPSSICPAGWRLPKSDGTSGSGNEFAILNAKMNNPNATSGSTSDGTVYAKNWWHTGLFAGPRSGYYYSGFGYQGFGGYFWSSSANSSNNAWNLYFRYSVVSPGTSYTGKDLGFAVRCVV